MRALRPTVDTEFHIDLSWWERQNKDIRIFMQDILCQECRQDLSDPAEAKIVDMVDPEHP